MAELIEEVSGMGSWAGKEFDSVGGPLGGSVSDVNVILSVVYGRGAEVPPVDAMWSPGPALCWFLMDDHVHAWRRKWCLIQIERAVDLRFFR